MLPDPLPDLHLKHTPAVFVSRSLRYYRRFGRPLTPKLYISLYYSEEKNSK